jgi:hypothetical protein
VGRQILRGSGDPDASIPLCLVIYLDPFDLDPTMQMRREGELTVGHQRRGFRQDVGSDANVGEVIEGSRDDGVDDGVQGVTAKQGVWSTSSIASCNVTEMWPEEARASVSSRCRWGACSAVQYNNPETSDDATERERNRRGDRVQGLTASPEFIVG